MRERLSLPARPFSLATLGGPKLLPLRSAPPTAQLALVALPLQFKRILALIGMQAHEYGSKVSEHERLLQISGGANARDKNRLNRLGARPTHQRKAMHAHLDAALGRFRAALASQFGVLSPRSLPGSVPGSVRIRAFAVSETEGSCSVHSAGIAVSGGNQLMWLGE